MQTLINEVYGTFDDDAHEVYRFDDTSPGVVIMRDNIVGSYETGGGVMLDWVVGVVEEEE